jgi:Fic-DOC domain mobile mystery protein B
MERRMTGLGSDAPHPFEAEDDAATPLAHEEKTGLIPSWVTFRHELNEVEQANIAKAALWASRQRRRELLDEALLRNIHKRMLGEVWSWAGSYRTTERNIGVPAWKIPMELRILLDDTRLWIARSVYEPDELAVRFHHRLVAIHPFPNGNGRHARLMADLLVIRLGGERFTWGSTGLLNARDIRARYVSALRQADNHDIAALLAFARS